MLVYPSLDYELNTMVRIHREANGYTQEEFAFLIGRDVADIIRHEDLTSTDAYDFNHTNRFCLYGGSERERKDITGNRRLEDPIKLRKSTSYNLVVLMISINSFRWVS